MSNLSRDEIKDLINNFNGYLLVTYYRQFDLDRLAIVSDLLYDINYSAKRKIINHISVDVSNIPELCSEQRLTPTCTVLYKNGRKEYVFGPFSDYDYMQALSNNLSIGEVNPTSFGATAPVTAVRIRSTIQ